MKATMKKSIACLLAVLLVIQMVPAFADQIITSYTPGNVIFRDKLEITPEAGKGTIMTVSMCISWLPMETAVMEAAPLNCPVMKRSARP